MLEVLLVVLWKSIVLGVVQGLTEFLPVSSSGHLVVWSGLLKADSTLAFDVALHFGSLIALIFYFWRDVIGLFQGFLATFRRDLSRAEKRKRTVFWLIVVSIVPSAIAGILLSDRIEAVFSNYYVVAAMFLVTALLLFLQRFCSTSRDIRDINRKDAMIIGIGQMFALLPGLSRSGTTMSAGVYCGLRQEDAAHFSFLMAIPTIAGATLLKAVDFVKTGLSSEVLLEVGIGVAVSVLTSLVAIQLLLGAARRGKIQWFAVYCVAAAAFTFAAHYMDLF